MVCLACSLISIVNKHESCSAYPKVSHHLHGWQNFVEDMAHGQNYRQPLKRVLAPTLGLALSVTGTLFALTYLPQLAIQIFTSGFLAPITTTLLVLSEAQTVTTLLAKPVFLSEALTDTFDAVLISKGQEHLVSQGREVTGQRGNANWVSRLGKSLSKTQERWSFDGIIKRLLYLPLNFIPVVGTVLFVLARAKDEGPRQLNRYWQLKGGKSKDEIVKERQGAFTAFGTVGVLLEMIPVVGVLFGLPNTVGAALWAAEMEKGEQGTAPELKEKARKAQ